MKSLICSFAKMKRCQAGALAFLYMSLSLAPVVHASDTEIYARDLQAADLTPTLMFMLDTSGSMRFCIDSTDLTDCSTKSKMRGKVLADTMLKFLQGSTTDGIKPIPGFMRVGMTTYSSDGIAGRVSDRARPLDALTELSDTGDMVTKIVFGYGDAEQPVSGVTNSANTVLNLGFNGTTQQSVGLNFREVLVPRGATVSNAYIRLTSRTTNNTEANWQIKVQEADNAVNYASAAINAASRTYSTLTKNEKPEPWVADSSYDIDVTQLVQRVVDRGARYTSSSTATNPGSWCGGNSMSFLIQDVSGSGTPSRVAYSSEGAAAIGDTSKAPTLVVSYVMSEEYSDNDNAKRWASCTYLPFTVSVPITNTNRLDDVHWLPTGSVTANSASLPVAQISSGARRSTGLRFRGVNVPRNAIINSASLSLFGFTTNTGVPDLAVYAYQSDNLPAFCTVSGGWAPTTTCTRPIASVSAPYIWQPPQARINDTQAYTVPPDSVTTDVFEQMIQAIVNRGGWNSGNAMGFRIEQLNAAANNNAQIYAADANIASRNPTLNISGYNPTPLTDLRALTTVREQLIARVNQMSSSLDIPTITVRSLPANNIAFRNGTPLGKAYVEAAKSLMGKSPSSDAQPFSNVVSSGGNYITPLSEDDFCAGNYIFALTDGDPSTDFPTSESNSNRRITTNAAAFGSDSCPALGSIGLSGISNSNTWSCMSGVAKKLANAQGGIAAKVNTSTVILGPELGDAQKGMRAVAAQGGGTYYTVSSSSTLVEAIQDTLNALLDVSGTVSAPGVAVNQLSRLTHLDQLYYAVFNPRAKDARWRGNLKRYRLDLVDRRIEDQASAAAIDPQTTFFSENATSFWSDVTEGPDDGANLIDGENAILGGAAAEMPAPDTRYGSNTARKLYSFYGSNPSRPVSGTRSLTQVVFGSNDLKTAMGIDNSAPNNNTIFTNLTAWLLGYEVPDLLEVDTYDNASPLRFDMGGAMHSRPVLVNYGYSGSLSDALADASKQDNTVFISTMDGVLHAVEAKSGKELFSFIPQELLPRVRTLYSNASQNLPEFGLDATWTVYRKDVNGDFRINPSTTGDRVVVYGGMRMGGRNYYALDVTDRTTPKLLFVLQGGASGPFANMGQTWSEPVIASVKVAGVAKTVLVFGGGYDDKHESDSYSGSSDSVGNQLYIVDAFTGEVYWWASSTGSPTMTVSDMRFAIPSTVKVVDSNDDGFADAIYVGDLGGQVFRADINNGNTAATGLVRRVKLFASLGQTLTGGANNANQRRFHEPPSVARFRDANDVPYMLVTMGSGYRGRPLNTATSDMFYALQDRDIFRSDVLTVADSSLQARIEGPLATGTYTGVLAEVNPSSTAGVTLNATTMGWFMRLGTSGTAAGEKVLAAPLVFNSEVYFTSYFPNATVDKCSPVQGQSRLYRFAATNAEVRTDTNGDGTITATDRFADNVVQGIGAEPQVIIQTNTRDQNGNIIAQNCPPLPSNKKAYCDGKEVSVTDLACTTVLVGTATTNSEYQCLSGLRRTRWYTK